MFFSSGNHGDGEGEPLCSSNQIECGSREKRDAGGPGAMSLTRAVLSASCPLHRALASCLGTPIAVDPSSVGVLCSAGRGLHFSSHPVLSPWLAPRPEEMLENSCQRKEQINVTLNGEARELPTTAGGADSLRGPPRPVNGTPTTHTRVLPRGTTVCTPPLAHTRTRFLAYVAAPRPSGKALPCCPPVGILRSQLRPVGCSHSFLAVCTTYGAPLISCLCVT